MSCLFVTQKIDNVNPHVLTTVSDSARARAVHAMKVVIIQRGTLRRRRTEDAGLVTDMGPTLSNDDNPNRVSITRVLRGCCHTTPFSPADTL